MRIGISTADGVFPIEVENEACIVIIEEISAMSPQDELADNGGIVLDSTQWDEDDGRGDGVSLTQYQLDVAHERLGAGREEVEGGYMDEDEWDLLFMEVWQEDLDLF